VAGERSRGRQYETDMVQPEEGAFLWAFLARPDQAGPPFTHTLVLPEPDEEGYWPEPGPAYTMTDCEPKGDEPSVSPPRPDTHGEGSEQGEHDEGRQRQREHLK